MTTIELSVASASGKKFRDPGKFHLQLSTGIDSQYCRRLRCFPVFTARATVSAGAPPAFARARREGRRRVVPASPLQRQNRLSSSGQNRGTQFFPRSVCDMDSTLVEFTKNKLGITDNTLNAVGNGVDLDGEFDTDGLFLRRGMGVAGADSRSCRQINECFNREEPAYRPLNSFACPAKTRLLAVRSGSRLQSPRTCVPPSTMPSARGNMYRSPASTM